MPPPNFSCQRTWSTVLTSVIYAIEAPNNAWAKFFGFFITPRAIILRRPVQSGQISWVMTLPGKCSTRLWPGPKILLFHRIKHLIFDGKPSLHHEFILCMHKITSSQSFRVFRHSPDHNSTEPGPIRINLVSFES